MEDDSDVLGRQYQIPMSEIDRVRRYDAKAIRRVVAKHQHIRISGHGSTDASCKPFSSQTTGIVISHKTVKGIGTKYLSGEVDNDGERHRKSVDDLIPKDDRESFFIWRPKR